MSESAHFRVGIHLHTFNFKTRVCLNMSVFRSQEPSGTDNMQDIHVVANNMISELALLCNKTELAV